MVDYELAKLFMYKCKRGKLEEAKELLRNNPNTIDISYQHEAAFKYAFMHGYLEVAKWLFEL